MLPKSLLITVRTLSKSKTFGLLNIAGLAIGITCAALIFLWVENEYSYNKMFPKYDRLYRIMEVQTYEGKRQVFQADPLLMADAVKTGIPGIHNAARTLLGEQFKLLFSLGDKGINEQGKYADSALFSMIDLPFSFLQHADPRHQAIASRLVKEIAVLGGDITPFTTPAVAKALVTQAKEKQA